MKRCEREEEETYKWDGERERERVAGTTHVRPSEWPARDARTTYQGEELFKEFCDAQSNTGPSKRALDIGYNVLFFSINHIINTT